MKINQKRQRRTFHISHRENLLEQISILNMYAPNTRAQTCIKETLLKVKSYTKPHTLIVGDFNTPLSPMDRSVRQNVNRKIKELKDVKIQMDLTDNYRII